MKILNTALFLVLLPAPPAFSQLRHIDDPARAFPERYGVNGFGARLVVTENPREYIRKWNRLDIPRIDSATHVRRDEPVGAFVVVTGCTPDAQGGCHAEADLNAGISFDLETRFRVR